MRHTVSGERHHVAARNRWRLGGLAVVLAAGLAGSRADAQSPTPDPVERYAPLILKLPATARVLSLGGAQVALRDADAVFGNPALVGTGSAVACGAERYGSGATLGHCANSSTFGPLGIGVGVQLLDGGAGFGPFPAPSTVLTRDDAAGTSSVAAALAASLTWKQLRWGVAAKYIEERVRDDRAGGVAIDVGVSKSLPFFGSTLGVAMQHLGPRLAVAGRRESLPAQLAVGLVTAPRGLGKWFDLLATAQLDVRRDGELFPRGGVELSYVPIEGVAFTGRMGGRRPQLLSERALAAGAGVTIDRVTLDYGWEALREGVGHRLTMRLR